MRALVLALLLLVASPAFGEGLPVCPRCDCWDQDCLIRPCHCGEPVTDESAHDLLVYALVLMRPTVGEAMDLDPPVDVKVVGPEELRLEDGVVALGTYRDGVIRIGRWLRRPEALVVLAHEYGHAWQDRTNPRAAQMTERFSEGFASWVAAIVGSRVGYLEVASRIRDRSGYAEGAKRFAAWEKEHGVETVLRLAAEWTDFSGEVPPKTSFSVP